MSLTLLIAGCGTGMKTSGFEPTVTITAGPTSITPGSFSTITVVATNATTVTLVGSDNTSYPMPKTGGTQIVSPSITTTYTATADGPGGKITQATAVSVTANPAPAVTITATPSSITESNSSLLVVSASNATQVTITGTDKSTYTLQASGGQQAVSPTVTTTYTVTAVGAGGSTAATAVVTVTPNPPPTVTITATPASISAGSSSVLTVSSSNSTAVTIVGSDQSTYILTSSDASQKVTPTITTTYTATAKGDGGQTSASATVTVTPLPTPAGTLTASPSSITSGSSSTLTYTAANATAVSITGTDGSSYSNLPLTGGTQVVTPDATTTYTLTVAGQPNQQTTASTTVSLATTGTVNDVSHVIFMLQENHSFDNYFGMLNPYRIKNNYNVGADGVNYAVDGIDDKLTGPNAISNTNDEGKVFPLFPFTSTCIDDLSSAWFESYNDVNKTTFNLDRTTGMDGFVHSAEGFNKSCLNGGSCAGAFTDTAGQRSMGYYDENTLNYYYNMASQFALSDRWFSPIASKSTDNRIATFTGGTTQGLTYDPGNDDGLPQLAIPSIFGELQTAGVSWKVYYTVTQGECLDADDCPAKATARFPGTNFSTLAEANHYLYIPSTPGECNAPTQSSNNGITQDSTGSFCVDPSHIAPLAQYYADLANGTLPSFAFIEAGYGNDDEHPGSGSSVLIGQAHVARVINTLMTSSSWKSSVFFFAYDEGGGPYDHVPPVPGHSNDLTDAMVGSATKASIPDIGATGTGIAVNPDSYNPCLPPELKQFTLHCDLIPLRPGAEPTDAPAQLGFSAQLGFRVPNMVVSPFTRAHYVSHIPMDHTAILKFVESRFIQGAPHLTARDAAQPDLLDFFNFQTPPWMTPPTPPAAITDPKGSKCHASTFAP